VVDKIVSMRTNGSSDVLLSLRCSLIIVMPCKGVKSYSNQTQGYVKVAFLSLAILLAALLAGLPWVLRTEPGDF
jgi:hypothetical protein